MFVSVNYVHEYMYVWGNSFCFVKEINFKANILLE